jgi:hypothetical protein
MADFQDFFDSMAKLGYPLTEVYQRPIIGRNFLVDSLKPVKNFIA